MYVFKFVQRSISRAVKGIRCPFFRRQNEGERVALVSEGEDQVVYASLVEQDEEGSQPELLGLTAEYQTWLGSKSARNNAFVHFVVYLLVAVIGFSFVLEEWPIYDSIYFAVVVFTTVGMFNDSSMPSNTMLFIH
jgi:hypothetical protein